MNFPKSIILQTGGSTVGATLDEVKLCITSHLLGFVDRNYPNILTIRPDQADLWNTNCFIDPIINCADNLLLSGFLLTFVFFTPRDDTK